MSGVPLLLPEFSQPSPSSSSWQPTKHGLPPNPPPVDEGQVRDQEMAAQRQLMDGKALKKTRPRRTVDYAGGMGRWGLVSCCVYAEAMIIHQVPKLRKTRFNPYYVPHLRPGPSYIIDVSCSQSSDVVLLQTFHVHCSASAAEGLSHQCFHFIMYKIRAYVYKQNTMSCECGDSASKTPRS